jgi:hypothetical protein
MLTTEQIIQMVWDGNHFDIEEPDQYCIDRNIVDSGNKWITKQVVALVHDVEAKVRDATLEEAAVKCDECDASFNESAWCSKAIRGMKS